MNLDNARAFISTCDVTPLQQVAMALLAELEQATPKRVAELEATVKDLDALSDDLTKLLGQKNEELAERRAFADSVQPTLAIAAAERAELGRRLTDTVAERDAMRAALDPARLRVTALVEELRQERAERALLAEAHVALQYRHAAVAGANYQLEQELKRYR